MKGGSATRFLLMGDKGGDARTFFWLNISKTLQNNDRFSKETQILQSSETLEVITPYMKHN